MRVVIADDSVIRARHPGMATVILSQHVDRILAVLAYLRPDGPRAAASA